MPFHANVGAFRPPGQPFAGFAGLLGTCRITFSSLPHRDVVRGLSSLAFRSDVHCPVPVVLEAVSEHRTLLGAQGETAGVKGLSVLTDEHVDFLTLKEKEQDLADILQAQHCAGVPLSFRNNGGRRPTAKT